MKCTKWNSTDVHPAMQVAEGAEIVLTMFDKDKRSRDDPMGVVRVPLREMDGQERAYALQVRVPIGSSYLV